MPLRQPERGKLMASDLRSRIQNLTRYDPDNASSDSETDGRGEFSAPRVSLTLNGNSGHTNGNYLNSHLHNENRANEHFNDTRQYTNGNESYKENVNSDIPKDKLQHYQQTDSFLNRYQPSRRTAVRFAENDSINPDSQNAPQQPYQTEINLNDNRTHHTTSSLPQMSGNHHNKATPQQRPAVVRSLSTTEIPRIQRPNSQHGVLSQSDIEILTIIASMADDQVKALAASGSDGISTTTEDYQFTYLYGAFEAFTNANALSPLTYPAYHTLFSALVNLSNYKVRSARQPGNEYNRTWKECVEAFSKSYSAAELKRNRYIQLREKLKLFDDATRERFLALWYESYISSNHETTRLNHLADTYANGTTTNTAASLLHRWVSKRIHISHLEFQARRIDDILTKEKIFSHWQDRIFKIRDDETIADGVLVQRVLRRWLKRTRHIRKMQQQATEFHRDNLMIDSMDTWRQRNVEAIVSRQYDTQLCTQAFTKWINKTATIVRARNLAEDWDTTNILTSTLNAWISKYDNIQNTAESTAVLYEDTLKRKTFVEWNRTLNDTVATEELQIKWRMRRARQILQDWRTRNLQVREARRFRDFMCAYRAFKSWRLAASCNSMMRSHNIALTSEIMKSWKRLERERVFIRISNRQLAIDVLFHWRAETIRKREERQFKLEQFSQRGDINLLKQCMAVWKYNSAQPKTNLEVARDFYETSNQNSAYKALTTWVRRTQQVLENEDQADEIYQFKLSERFVDQWKHAVVSLRRKKRDRALQQLLKQKEIALKQKAFQALLIRFEAVLEMDQKAETIVTSRDNETKQQVMNVWLNKLSRIYNLQSVADTLSGDNLLHHKFVSWRSNMERVRTIDKQAQNMEQETNNSTIDNIFRIWRIRMFKLQTKQSTAKEFSDRGDRRKAKLMLRMWRDKSTEREQLRYEYEIQNQQPYTNGNDVFGNIKSTHTNSMTVVQNEPLFRGPNSSSNLNAAAAAAARLAPFNPVGSNLNGSGSVFYSAPRPSSGRGESDVISPLKDRQIHPTFAQRQRTNNQTHSPPLLNFNELNEGISRLNMTEPRPTSRHQPVSPPGPNYALETPTRSRIRKPVPMTSISRWKLAMTTGNADGNGALTPSQIPRLRFSLPQASDPTNNEMTSPAPRNDIGGAGAKLGLSAARRRGSIRIQEIARDKSEDE